MLITGSRRTGRVVPFLQHYELSQLLRLSKDHTMVALIMCASSAMCLLRVNTKHRFPYTVSCHGGRLSLHNQSILSPGFALYRCAQPTYRTCSQQASTPPKGNAISNYSPPFVNQQHDQRCSCILLL